MLPAKKQSIIKMLSNIPNDKIREIIFLQNDGIFPILELMLKYIATDGFQHKLAENNLRTKINLQINHGK